jgi:transposase
MPFAPFGFEEDTFIIEVEVKAYRRRIRRRRYRRTCSCPGQPSILAAPVAPRVLPHSQFGVSVWVGLLLDKYAYCRPTAKGLDDLRSHGLDLAPGTITDNLKRLAPLFEPLQRKLLERSRTQALWNADETRWPVFCVVKGKVGYRWYIWLFESKDCVVFTLDKGRGHDVPEDHFGKDAVGIVVVDRYSAYKAMKLVKEGKLRLAFCWAHQRRDFLDVGKELAEAERLGSGMGGTNRPVVPTQRRANGSGREEPGLGGKRPEIARSSRSNAQADGRGAGRGETAPSEKESAGEHEGALGRVDDLRG